MKRIVSNELAEFESQIGSGICRLNNVHGRKVNDIIGVEFDIDADLQLGKDAFLVSQKSCFIKYIDTHTEIEGSIDGIDNYDRLIYLRLGIDCLIMVPAIHSHLKEGDGLNLKIPHRLFVITTIGI